jgi:phage tail sheath protein FI
MEGVSTSTAGFIGPTRFGPTRGVPEVLTNYADFERIYGGLEQVRYGDSPMTNYLAQAVKAFFNEGGGRVYVTRVYEQKDENTDGKGRLTLKGAATDGPKIDLSARHPGEMGNLRVTFMVKAGLNILAAADGKNLLRGVNNYDMVWVRPKPAAADTDKDKDKDKGDDKDKDPEAEAGKGSGKQAAAGMVDQVYFVEVTRDGDQVITKLLDSKLTLSSSEVQGDIKLLDPAKFTVHILTINVAVSFYVPGAKSVPAQLFNGLSFHPLHANALSSLFAENPSSKSTELYVPLVVGLPAKEALKGVFFMQKDANGKLLHEALAAKDPAAGDMSASFTVTLTGGSDGKRPTAKVFEGDDGDKFAGLKSGFAALADLDDIAIVAAPGSTYLPKLDDAYKSESETITRTLINHCTQLRYRVAILDTPNDMLVSQVREYRSSLDSAYAALYYPWLRVLDPVTGTEINLPPSGFVAGIWARNDTENGVHKAPANEVVRTALGLQVMLNKGQQDVLNPEGINCFRFFEGRGIRLWGARTISSDSEWKYVNVRRYFAYLEHSIDKGTQWVVFQSNGQPLWDKVKQMVNDFLFNEWKSERLLGSAPAEAYFVRCDRSTMTQNDLDNGRLICQIGVAPLKPAEFVVFRVGQWTASK